MAWLIQNINVIIPKQVLPSVLHLKLYIYIHIYIYMYIYIYISKEDIAWFGGRRVTPMVISIFCSVAKVPLLFQRRRFNNHHQNKKCLDFL